MKLAEKGTALSNTVFFAHARTAFWYGLQQLTMERGQTMLVPDYVCDAVLHPLKDLGINTIFYPIDDNFIPDWKTLETLVSGKPAHAFLLVHYFGQPQDIKYARKFCDLNGLWLIEDNAHGFGGELNGKALGSFGDMGFSSPRKQLQNINGGMLYLHGKPLEVMKNPLPVFSAPRSKELLSQVINRFPRIKARLRRIIRPEPDFSNPSNFIEIRKGYYKADTNSVQRILAENWDNHAESRREVWSEMGQFMIENGLKPVWKKPHPESCPWVMPVYANSQYDRLHWIHWSRKKGADFFPWPSLPEEIIQSSHSAVARWKQLLCIPLYSKPKDYINL